MARVEELKKGMTVYSHDGHRLGKVLAIGHSQFQVERGLFFHRDFLVDVGEVAEVQGRRVVLLQRMEDVRGAKGGFSDKGYCDRGLAGDTGTGPLRGIGSGLAPALGTAGEQAAAGPSGPTVARRAPRVAVTEYVPSARRRPAVTPVSEPARAAVGPGGPVRPIVELNFDEEYERLVTPDPHVNPVA